MLDDLVSRSLAYRTGPELRALMDFARRFPHLAPYNAMLLHMQNPGIAYALRACDWERKYARKVKPGARPYVILWTMGPVAFVFDLSDTEPVNPDDDRVPGSASDPFHTRGHLSFSTLKKLMDACRKIGIEIEERDLGTAMAGQVRRIKKGSVAFHILLNEKHTPAQQLGTLAHELAHIFCGHLGMIEQAFWSVRENLTLTTREFEAEAAAYLVTDRYDLDIGSAAYLSGYLSASQPLPSYSLDAVLKAAGKIEEMLAGRFRPKPKGK